MTEDQIKEFEHLAKSGISPDQFYQRAKEKGISPYQRALLLRDFYGLNLRECMKIQEADGDATTT